MIKRLLILASFLLVAIVAVLITPAKALANTSVAYGPPGWVYPGGINPCPAGPGPNQTHYWVYDNNQNKTVPFGTASTTATITAQAGVCPQSADYSSTVDSWFTFPLVDPRINGGGMSLWNFGAVGKSQINLSRTLNINLSGLGAGQHEFAIIYVAHSTYPNEVDSVAVELDFVVNISPPPSPSVKLTVVDNDQGGSATQNSSTAPAPTPAPTLTVSQNADLNFNWTSANVVNCAKYDDWPGDDGTASGTGVPTSHNVDRGTQDTTTLGTKQIYIDCAGPGGHAAAHINVIVTNPPPTTDQVTLRDNNTGLAITGHQNGTHPTLQATVGDVLVVSSYKSANVTACAATGVTGWNGVTVSRNTNSPPNVPISLPGATANPVSGPPGSLITLDCTDSAGAHFTSQVHFTVVSPSYHPFFRTYRGDTFACATTDLTLAPNCTTSSQDQPIGSLGAPTIAGAPPNGDYASELIIASAIGTSDFCSTRGYNFGAQDTDMSDCISGPYVPGFNAFKDFLTNVDGVGGVGGVLNQPAGCASPYANSQTTAYVHATLPGNTLSLGSNVNTQTLGSGSAVCGNSGDIYTTPAVSPPNDFTIKSSVAGGAAATLNQGTATIFVNGNVNISNDIMNAFTGTYAGPGNIPSLAIIATGDIDIAPGVQNLDLSLFAGGAIRTCSTTTTDSYGTAACKNPLNIRGLVIANSFELARNHFLTAGFEAAEKVILSAHVLAFPPPGFADISTIQYTQAQTLFQENNGRF